ncbi:hypothetical protein FVE85_2280 [Porphyridium purpureum]|uniref:Protein NLRC3 n=1 Tax=Porphyridium purpureum TaxID=35688 RepID=A0A5J4YYC2_PORPP|nr:hypothetical protein FVE85_2280 [Porphyridium purpureum]|eukprot:POR7359..scf209_3
MRGGDAGDEVDVLLRVQGEPLATSGGAAAGGGVPLTDVDVAREWVRLRNLHAVPSSSARVALEIRDVLLTAALASALAEFLRESVLGQIHVIRLVNVSIWPESHGRDTLYRHFFGALEAQAQYVHTLQILACSLSPGFTQWCAEKLLFKAGSLRVLHVHKSRLSSMSLASVLWSLLPGGGFLRELELIACGVNNALVLDPLNVFLSSPFSKELRSLVLDANELDNDAVESIASAFQKHEHPHIDLVSVAKNHISDRGARSLATACRDARLIDLRENSLGEECKTSLHLLYGVKHVRLHNRKSSRELHGDASLTGSIQLPPPRPQEPEEHWKTLAETQKMRSESALVEKVNNDLANLSLSIVSATAPGQEDSQPIVERHGESSSKRRYSLIHLVCVAALFLIIGYFLSFLESIRSTGFTFDAVPI